MKEYVDILEEAERIVAQCERRYKKNAPKYEYSIEILVIIGALIFILILMKIALTI